jgi:hypothetical protein
MRTKVFVWPTRAQSFMAASEIIGDKALGRALSPFLGKLRAAGFRYLKIEDSDDYFQLEASDMDRFVVTGFHRRDEL